MKWEGLVSGQLIISTSSRWKGRQAWFLGSSPAAVVCSRNIFGENLDFLRTSSLVPRPSTCTPPVFDRLKNVIAYCKRSKLGGVEGLGMRL